LILWFALCFLAFAKSYLQVPTAASTSPTSPTAVFNGPAAICLGIGRTAARDLHECTSGRAAESSTSHARRSLSPTNDSAKTFSTASNIQGFLFFFFHINICVVVVLMIIIYVSCENNRKRENANYRGQGPKTSSLEPKNPSPTCLQEWVKKALG
jgi:hypothetical protein